jgi:hypothetical protein
MAAQLHNTMKKQLTLLLAALCFLCNAAIAQLPAYLPADGLVGWWPFNGNANDESGNGNHGTVNGATLTEDRFGNANSAYSFSSNTISIAHNPSLGFEQTGAQTVSLWAKATGSQSVQHLMGKRPNGASQFNWQIAFNYPAGIGLTYVGYGNSVLFGAVTDYQLELNSWVNIVCTYDNGEWSIYLNGDLINSTNSSLYAPDVNTPLTFGNSGGFQPFYGLLDDIAIYNRALSPQEIQNLYTDTNQTVDTGDGAAPLPQGIPYQAAARDAQGQVIADAPVNVRFSLHEGAVDGAVSYSETHALTTNSIGLFNTEFGNGTPEQSAFDSINWAATTKFLQVEIDLGDGYVDMGTTQLLSVPYAFRSDEAACIKNAGLPIFADNTAALAGGLVAGEMYRTATGDLKVVY